MIVECGGCLQQYKINLIDKPQILPGGKFGWIILCGNCKKQWILYSKENCFIRNHPEVIKRPYKKLSKTIFILICFLLIFLASVFFVKKTQLFETKQILIKNVKSTLKPIDKIKQQILIFGEIINQSNRSLPLKSLKMSVFSNCKNDQTCLGFEWNHEWSRNTILPGERISFKSTYEIPIDYPASKVEVTWP